MELKKTIKNIRYYIRDITINKRYRNKLKNEKFSLITSDCIGGVLCKDLHERMNSPTRNFYFNADDFVKFCSNLEHYINLIPEEYDGDYKEVGAEYLMASLGDLKMFLVHYTSLEQARDAWIRRSKRLNKNNMFFIMTDRNFCTEKEIRAFDELPYKNKVCFTHIPYPQYKSTYYIKGSENDHCLNIITDYVFPFWIKRYYDQFDFVRWINEGNYWTE